MTLVPACLLIVSMVSCWSILYMKSRVSLGEMPVSLDIWAMLWAHPSVMLFLMSATPLPRRPFSWASASARSTALILAASPSFLAAILRRSEALISFMDLRTSSGGVMFLTWALSMVNPPSFILGPTFSMMASEISAWDQNSWSRVRDEDIFLTVFSVQEIIWLTGSVSQKKAFSVSSWRTRYCSEISRTGNTLSAVLTCILQWFSDSLFETRLMDWMTGMQKVRPGVARRLNFPKVCTTPVVMLGMNLKIIFIYMLLTSPIEFISRALSANQAGFNFDKLSVAFRCTTDPILLS